MSDRRKILAGLIILLAAVAFGVSTYLTWVTWQASSVAGCTAESSFDCDDVLGSRWSKWFGLPVSLLGALSYLAVLGLAWPAALRQHGLAMAGLFALALLDAGAALWFVGLQALELQSFCFYCLTVHACGLAIGGLALLLYTDTSDAAAYDMPQPIFGAAAVDSSVDVGTASSDRGGLRLLASLAFAAVGMSALMGGQLLWVPPSAMPMEQVDFPSLGTSPGSTALEDSTVDAREARPAQHDDNDPTTKPSHDDLDWLERTSDSSAGQITSLDNSLPTIGSLVGAGPRQIKFKALPEPIDVAAMPLLGRPDAEHVLVEMMDYTCKHCRRLHPHLSGAVARYGGSLSVVVHHVPLSKKCNPSVRKDAPGKKHACDYAQLAIDVWNLAPEKFPEFHDWLLESEKVPNITKARSRAVSLVGARVFDTKLKNATSQRLSKQSQNWKRLDTGLPVLLLTNGAIRGVPEQSQALYDSLESILGVVPRGATPEIE